MPEVRLKGLEKVMDNAFTELVSKHKWFWCSTCQIESVACGTCGNNVCNGGCGTISDGKGGTKECPDCESAYQLWQNTLLDPDTHRRKA